MSDLLSSGRSNQIRAAFSTVGLTRDGGLKEKIRQVKIEFTIFDSNHTLPPFLNYSAASFLAVFAPFLRGLWCNFRSSGFLDNWIPSDSSLLFHYLQYKKVSYSKARTTTENLTMLFSTAPFFLAFFGIVVAQDTSLFEVKRAFDNSHIPGNISLAFEPKALLEVSFAQPTGKSIVLKAGVQLPRNATAGPPTFSVVGPVGKGPFVVAAVDLDAPTPQNPTSAQIRHFLGGNFVLKTPRTPLLLTNTTPALSEFRQPTPPAGSDPHRYVFLLFDQSKKFNTQTLVNQTTSIALFNISTFAAAVGLGQPIGGTFMLVGPPPAT